MGHAALLSRRSNVATCVSWIRTVVCAWVLEGRDVDPSWFKSRCPNLLGRMSSCFCCSASPAKDDPPSPPKQPQPAPAPVPQPVKKEQPAPSKMVRTIWKSIGSPGPVQSCARGRCHWRSSRSVRGCSLYVRDQVTPPVLPSTRTQAPTKVYIIIYSMYGHIKQMAEAAKKGVEEVEGVEATIYQVRALARRVCAMCLAKHPGTAVTPLEASMQPWTTDSLAQSQGDRERPSPPNLACTGKSSEGISGARLLSTCRRPHGCAAPCRLLRRCRPRCWRRCMPLPSPTTPSSTLTTCLRRTASCRCHAPPCQAPQTVGCRCHGCNKAGSQLCNVMHCMYHLRSLWRLLTSACASIACAAYGSTALASLPGLGE